VSFRLFLVNAIKQIFDFLFDLMTILNNFHHTLSLNQILFFTQQPNTLRLKRKQQTNPDRGQKTAKESRQGIENSKRIETGIENSKRIETG
jgi:hypothetical protein